VWSLLLQVVFEVLLESCVQAGVYSECQAEQMVLQAWRSTGQLQLLVASFEQGLLLAEKQAV
jgi:hypothetical protein